MKAWRVLAFFAAWRELAVSPSSICFSRKATKQTPSQRYLNLIGPARTSFSFPHLLPNGNQTARSAKVEHAL
jgi:hypothetical protein